MNEVAIQAQLRLTEELVAAEERWRELVQGLRDIVFRCDRDGCLRFLNDPWETVLGHRIDDCLNQTLVGFAHPDDRPALTAMLVAATEQKVASRQEIRFRGKDDTWMWFEVSFQARQSKTVIGLMYNIQPFKVLESELRNAQAETQRLIEAQRKTIKLLATPVIEVAEGVLIAPLVGAIDQERAEQLLQSVLLAVSTRKASSVIVDITGVLEFGPEVAQHLDRLGRATKLLGATCWLVGLSPQNAAMLVNLGVDLRGLSTSGSLLDGLQKSLASRGSQQRVSHRGVVQ